MKTLKSYINESFNVNEKNIIRFSKSKTISKLKTGKEFDDSIKLEYSKFSNTKMFDKKWNPLDFTYSLSNLEKKIMEVSKKGGFDTKFDITFDKKNDVIVLTSKNTFDKKHFDKVSGKFTKNDESQDKAKLVWVIVGTMDENDENIELMAEPIPHKVF